MIVREGLTRDDFIVGPSSRLRRRRGGPGEGGALPMGRHGVFITGSDFLMDGGVTAAYWFGDLAPGT